MGASTGDPGSTTSEKYAEDIRAAVAFLRQRPGIDCDRIALLGHSEGGSVATMIGATDARLRGIVLLAAPARTGKDVMLEQIAWIVAQDPSLSKTAQDSVLKAAAVEYDVDSATIGTRRWANEQLRATLAHDTGTAARELDTHFAKAASGTDFGAVAMPASLRFFLKYDPRPTAMKVRMPVLLLQGQADRQVKPEHVVQLAAAFRRGGNAEVTVRLFPDVNHLFIRDSVGDPRNYRRLPSQQLSAQVLGTIADWLADHVGVQ